VSIWPLAFVSGLTFGDYLVWHWSLNSNHDVIASVSGLTLPPLGVACMWLLVLSAMRVLARHGRRPASRARRLAADAQPGGAPATGARAGGVRPGTAGAPQATHAAGAARGKSSGKIAA